jgi:hypothetical protein
LATSGRKAIDSDIRSNRGVRGWQAEQLYIRLQDVQTQPVSFFHNMWAGVVKIPHIGSIFPSKQTRMC